MSTSSENRKRRVVIGGGISGLAAASRLIELAPHDEVVLLEAGPHLGGVLQTVRRDGYLIEQSADNFITDMPAALELCRHVGLAEALLPTAHVGRRALVVHRGRLVPVPEGFMLLAPSRLWPVLNSPLLSWRGKLRLACEPLVAQRSVDAAEETLAEFATRRLGAEAYSQIVAPLVAAIYGGDPARLSVAATLPRFVDMERQHGSLLRAARQAARSRAQVTSQTPAANGDQRQSGARYGLFLAPRDGMVSLVEAVARTLPPGSIRLQSPVSAFEKDAARGWRISLAGGEALLADAVVIATPIAVAGELLAPLDAAAAELCRSVTLSSCAVVSLGYDVRAGGIAPPGFGFVVPAAENRPILAASFASAKFPHRAPAGHLLVRVFIGGAGHEDAVQKSDEALVEIARRQLAELTELTGQPALALVSRWPASMPQYHLGHVERMARLQSRVASLGALALAGNAYEGVGIPQCIHSGTRAAEAVVQRAPA